MASVTSHNPQVDLIKHTFFAFSTELKYSPHPPLRELPIKRLTVEFRPRGLKRTPRSLNVPITDLNLPIHDLDVLLNGPQWTIWG